MRLFIGEDLPQSKVRSSPNLEAIDVHRLKTSFATILGRTIPWHFGLIGALSDFSPDVILCEGESNIFSYLQAIWYQKCTNSRVALMHWCFIELPGEIRTNRKLIEVFKARMRKYFDAFVVYSAYSKIKLIAKGQRPEEIFVATNVGQVSAFMRESDAIQTPRDVIRKDLGIPDRFTVIYAGSLDVQKRPELVLEVASRPEFKQINFILLGTGELMQELQLLLKSKSLSNVYIIGRVNKDVAMYYKAADVLIIPGRGGIVISEAMACGLPVIVHNADGTEYDLVQSGITGMHLGGGTVEEFSLALGKLISEPVQLNAMKKQCRALIETTFNERKMAREIVRAAFYAQKRRESKVSVKAA